MEFPLTPPFERVLCSSIRSGFKNWVTRHAPLYTVSATIKRGVDLVFGNQQDPPIPRGLEIDRLPYNSSKNVPGKRERRSCSLVIDSLHYQSLRSLTVMYTKTVTLTMALLVTMSVWCQEVRSQRSVHALASVGYSAVDEGAFTHDTAYNWSKTMSGLHVQALLGTVGAVNVGAEFGYGYLFWYEVRRAPACDACAPGYSSRDVDAYRLMVMGRMSLDRNWFAEFGFGPYFFGEFTDLAIAGGLGYALPLSSTVQLPLKARGDLISDADANLFTLGISAGISYMLSP